MFLYVRKQKSCSTDETFSVCRFKKDQFNYKSKPTLNDSMNNSFALRECNNNPTLLLYVNEQSLTSTEALVSLLQLSVTANRKVWMLVGSTVAFHISRPAGDREAPWGADTRVKRTVEPSGSRAFSWKVKLSPWKDRRGEGSGCSSGGSLSDGDAKGGSPIM